MSQHCENIKAQIEEMRGLGLSDKAKLVALLEACGITDREEVERLLECKASTLRNARRALKIQRQKSVAVCASDGNPAPEIRHSDGNPSKTTEIQRQKSVAPSCAHATKESLRDNSFQDKQTNTHESVRQSEAEAPLKAAFNGSTENLITDICQWMGGVERKNAAKWLTTMVSLHGRDIVLATYQQLVATQAQGGLVANPIAYFSKVATELKRKGVAKPAPSADVLPFKLSTATNLKPREFANA